MTGEYLPAGIVVIGNLLLLVLIVLTPRLSDLECKGVPRELTVFIVLVSFVIAGMLFLGISLNAYGLARYRIYVPPTTAERSLESGGEPASQHHDLRTDTDWNVGGTDRRVPADSGLGSPEETRK